jgi:hypothetical protein
LTQNRNPPQCVISPEGNGTGLLGTYYYSNYTTLAGSEVDSTIAFNWKVGEGPKIVGDAPIFAVNWTGYILPRLLSPPLSRFKLFFIILYAERK